MALQPLVGAGLWVPGFTPITFEEAATYIIDATGEKAVLVLRCPRAGVLDRFDAYVHTVTNSPDNGLRFSFQGVNLADGQNDGTILGATSNASVTYAHTVTTGWKQTNFGETVTVTRNQLIACVVDIPTFTAGDSVAMRGVNTATSHRFPYSVSATGTKQAVNVLLIGLHYTDGYAYLSPLMATLQSYASLGFNVNSATADEWGLAFQVPWPCKFNQVRVALGVAAGANFEMLVYDSDGSTVLSTVVCDGDVTGSTAVGMWELLTETELTLVANTTYRVSIRPTTTATVTMDYHVFNSAEHMQTKSGGANFYMTSRLNQSGAWTDYNAGTFRMALIWLQLSAVDDGVGAGGGLLRHPAMAGGMNA